MEKKQVVENYKKFHKTQQSTVNLNKNGYLTEYANKKNPSPNRPSVLRRDAYK
jgi:hypothetical protein